MTALQHTLYRHVNHMTMTCCRGHWLICQIIEKNFSLSHC